MSDFPGRPDHPDFAKLSAIVIEQDRLSRTAGFDFAAHLGEYSDTESVTYMARQRAMKVASAGLPRTLTIDVLIAAMGAAYLDGFMTGYLFDHGVDG